MNLRIVFGFIVLLHPCLSRSLDNEDASVVSVYTTQPSMKGTKPLDVYHEIAKNVVGKLTSPLYRFLAIDNKMEEEKNERKLHQIELLDENPEETAKFDVKPVDNDLSERDIEEVTVEATRKTEKKPEKITLYSNNEEIVINDTANEISDDEDDEPFDFDDEVKEKPREGPLIYFLELIGSWLQLFWGAMDAIFRPSSGFKE